MTKITIIGAGGFVFPLRLIGDIISFPELRDSTLALMDVDLPRAERTAAAARELIGHYDFPTRVQAITDRRAALAGADFVIITFYIDDETTARVDKAIPGEYGIDQPVGDTLGPGGVIRCMRNAPVCAALAAEIKELCPTPR